MRNQNKLGRHVGDYRVWLKEIKAKVRQVQLKAAVAVNEELLRFYWELGADIAERQKSAAWGSGFLKQPSQDLMAEFPEMKGFSKRNLEQIRRWFLFWSRPLAIAKQAASQIVQQPVAQITRIPWWHNVVIITKCQSREEALYYVQNTIEHGWSRSVLTHQIESGLWQREGKALNNFTEALSPPQSDLAAQTLKDPYIFDFLALRKNHKERLAFHWKCMMAPQTIVDYIMVHELCHFHYRDHFDAFWNEVDKVMPKAISPRHLLLESVQQEYSLIFKSPSDKLP